MVVNASTWWFVGVLALIFSTTAGINSVDRVQLRIGGELTAVLLWAWFAVNSFAVRESTGLCCSTVTSHGALGVVTGLVAVILLFDVLSILLARPWRDAAGQ